MVEVRPHAPTALSPRQLEAGEVGYLTASIKTCATPAWAIPSPAGQDPAPEPLPGYRTVTADGVLRHLPGRRRRLPRPADALEKLQLNDASLTFEPETSVALGFGFRCGFLGLLHMEIIRSGWSGSLTSTSSPPPPSVMYRLQDRRHGGADRQPALPRPDPHRQAEEPFVNAHIYTPNDMSAP